VAHTLEAWVQSQGIVEKWHMCFCEYYGFPLQLPPTQDLTGLRSEYINL
jgi:hypothetical protein